MTCAYLTKPVMHRWNVALNRITFTIRKCRLAGELDRPKNVSSIVCTLSWTLCTEHMVPTQICMYRHYVTFTYKEAVHVQSSNNTPSCAANYRRHEKAKWNMYEEWIREVEHASFTPVVFTTSGRASPLTSTFLKHLASRLAEKQDMAYSTTIGWLRARLNFSLLRSAVMCIRRSRSPTGRTLHDSTPDVTVVESRLQMD